MARRRDLIFFMGVWVLSALLASRTGGPSRETPALPTPVARVQKTIAAEPTHAPTWVKEHHRDCTGRKVARIEELRRCDPFQKTLIDRGLVVYVAGEGCCVGITPDMKAGKAIWLGGQVFGPDPQPGNSWYCKGCGSRWGEYKPYFSLLDHP